MDRAELLAVFHGEGPVPVLWATGCPVHFDVWLAFAEPPPSPSSYRQDLILAVREEYGVERALERLQQLRLTDECRPVAAGIVAAQMTLEELVTALLPLTSLAGVVRVAHELAVDSGTEGMEAALHGHVRAPATSEIHDNMRRRQEHPIVSVTTNRRATRAVVRSVPADGAGGRSRQTPPSRCSRSTAPPSAGPWSTAASTRGTRRSTSGTPPSHRRGDWNRASPVRSTSPVYGRSCPTTRWSTGSSTGRPPCRPARPARPPARPRRDSQTRNVPPGDQHGTHRKQILCATATDLARERDFQGRGLVDVLRAMQSV